MLFLARSGYYCFVYAAVRCMTRGTPDSILSTQIYKVLNKGFVLGFGTGAIDEQSKEQRE